MKKYSSLILCEGETDQALIGSYLEATSGWKYQKKGNGYPFQEENVNIYLKDNSDALGIWQIGGNDFIKAISTIMNGEKKDKVVDRIVVVTDHDDSGAETLRPQSILDAISSALTIEKLRTEDFFNKWSSIEYTDAFGAASTIQFCYMLVPLDSVGALETFMMKSLSEQNTEQDNVINQAKSFVKNFSSAVYLRSRREKVKAELGVSLAVFSPDRVFTTMKELIDSVQWGSFTTANTQFELLREL